MNKRSVLMLVFCSTLVSGVCRAQGHSGEVTHAETNMQESDRVSGIQGLMAPGSAVPKIGPNGTVLDYVRWAKSSLDRGQTAEAELSLEWGQLRRRIDEEENALALSGLAPTYDSQCLRSMCMAMRSIGDGHAADGSRYLDAALAEFTREARPFAGYSDPAKGAAASTMEVGIEGDGTSTVAAK